MPAKKEDALLDALGASDGPVSALTLSRKLGVAKSQVNSTLYAMERSGRVARCSATSGTGPPLWEPAPLAGRLPTKPPEGPGDVSESFGSGAGPAQSAKDINDPQQPESQVIEVLRKNPGGLGPASVTRVLGVKRKGANALLYGLQRDGLVIRKQTSPPLWLLSAKGMLQPPHATDCIETEGNNPERLPAAPSSAVLPTEAPSTSVRTESNTASSERRRESQDPTDAGLLAQSDDHQSKADSMVAQDPPAVCKRNGKSITGGWPEVLPAGDVNPGWGLKVAQAVWERFHRVCPSSSGRNVVAGVVLTHRTGCNDGATRVVALGSGSKTIKGDQLSLQGRTVQDCHAEVVARRSLLRWLYAQIEAARGSSADAAVICSLPGSARPYRLRPGLELWLYVSCAPCGDAAIFSRADQGSKANEEAAKAEGGHSPAWTRIKTAGLLRSKLEAGSGTVPVREGQEEEPGIDGVNRGHRVRRHSCSDKIAKWAVVGVQGSLLSRLIDPVYLSGVVVGDLFSAPHLHRALCCRSQRALSGSELPAPFRLHHLRALPGQPSDTRRHEAVLTTKKHSSQSANWAEGDPQKAELLDGGTGALKPLPEQPTGQMPAPSRISKAVLFSIFCRLVPGASALTYSENKQKAEAYHLAKGGWVEAMKRAGFGCWLRRPSDADHFEAAKSAVVNPIL